MAFISVDQAKQHLRLTGTAEDDRLNTFVAAAAEQIAERVGPLEPSTITEKVTATGAGVLVLTETPVISLTSLTPVVNWTPLIAVDVLDVDQPTGVVERIDGIPLRGRWTVVYQAGFVTVPSTITLAGLDLVMHWWRQSQSHTSVTYGESSAVTDFADLPHAVVNKLRPYMRLPGR